MSQPPPASSRATTDPDSSASLSCTQCQAPLGPGDKRCPFCGAPRPEVAADGTARPAFEPATVGVTPQSQAKFSSRPFVVVKRPKETSPMAILGGFVLVGALGYGGLSYYQHTHPPPAPSAPVKLPPLPPVISSVSGLSVPDAATADPTLLLPSVRRALFPGGEKAELIRIRIVGSTRGSVDLTRPGTEITYTYAPSGKKEEPRDSKEPRMFPGYTLKAEGGGPAQIAAMKQDFPVPEPNCIWSAAWRAAVKSGVPQEVAVDGVYEKTAEGPRWRISVPDKPELSRDLDGMTCVLKPH